MDGWAEQGGGRPRREIEGRLGVNHVTELKGVKESDGLERSSKVKNRKCPLNMATESSFFAWQK